MLSSTYAQTYCCGTCFGYIGPTGKRVPYVGGEPIVWTECARCMERRVELEAEEEERRGRQEKRRRPRVCALEGCDERFAPGSDWQRFCCDSHRWRAHRLAKRQRAAAA